MAASPPASAAPDLPPAPTTASAANTISILSALEPAQTVSFVQRTISDSGHLALSPGQELVWDIKNKYYSARVQFQILTGDLYAAIDQAKLSPAVVALVRDPVETDLKLLRACDWSGLDIKLLVALGAGPLLPHEVESASDLALEAEFEFVDAQGLPGSLNAGDEGDSDEDFESVGIPRIREALQAHMWSTAEDAAAQASPTASDVTPASNTDEHPSAPAQTFEDDFTPYVSAQDSHERQPDLLHDPAASELDDFDSLSVMLGQLKTARDHSLSLDDDQQRRAFAEKATRRFLQGLGASGDYSDDEEVQQSDGSTSQT